MEEFESPPTDVDGFDHIHLDLAANLERVTTLHGSFSSNVALSDLHEDAARRACSLSESVLQCLVRRQIHYSLYLYFIHYQFYLYCADTRCCGRKHSATFGGDSILPLSPPNKLIYQVVFFKYYTVLKQIQGKKC